MEKKPKTDYQVYKRLLTYVKPHKLLFIISIFGFVLEYEKPSTSAH